ncbi:Flp pilus assembly protein CpaB [Parvibaculum lavamentivorans]|nr:Flp pilus assembly protein CpaB [Parvibaculum lavamentivorans]
MNLVQRMQRSPLLLLGLGIALIIAALALIWSNISSRDATSARAPAGVDDGRGLAAENAVTVLVAARDVVRGQRISEADLGLRRMEGPAPSGSFADAQSAIGRVATDDIRSSQIIFQQALSSEPAAAGIAALVPEGQRAFAIRIAEEDIVGGFLQAGDRVDVFATFPGAVYGQQGGLGQREGDQSKSALLLQDMQVLAVGPALSHQAGQVNAGARTVTVAAPPNALARLALAGRLGHITLAIRNPGDREVAPGELVALDDLRPAGAAVAPVEAKSEGESGRPGGHRITIYSGANQSVVETPR